MNWIMINEIENGYTVYQCPTTTFCANKADVIKKVMEIMNIETENITVKVEEISKEKFDNLITEANKMPVATHVIKIKAEFNLGWNEEKLRELIKSKAKEVDNFFSLDLELFKIENYTIDVWFFIEFVGVKDAILVKNMIGKWLKDHIKEEGITIKSLDVEEVSHGNLRIRLNDVSLKNL